MRRCFFVKDVLSIMYSNRAKRAIIWNILYYVLCMVGIFYLKGKEKILNWDVMLVFLPLVILAISSETFPIMRKKGDKGLKPYCFIDFISKVLAYIWSQLIYRHIVNNLYFWIFLCLIAVSFVVSIVCSILMIKQLSK